MIPTPIVRFKPSTRTRGLLWTPAEKERVRDLYNEGYDDEEIAEMIGRTATATMNIRCRLGLKKRRKPSKRFVLKGADSEYYPKFYVEILEKRWREQFMK